ncbi:hypothetical protein C8R45DRAFT_1221181 [Mycena sanguinolenta]|nr:hypothetical protein C8R45DRAFT_1221181 [Mycena sanguinolenta]
MRWKNLVSKKQMGYVGIINQAATAYISCTLQVMFFICSLRRAIYRIPTEDVDPKGNVALALQNIFYNLQVSSTAVTTTGLTAAFGWYKEDLWIELEHDIFDFHERLQDKLIALMKGTTVETAIDDLYSGILTSRIKCISVDYEAVRREPFNNISLHSVGMMILRDSFKDFVSVGLANGDSKYETQGFGLQDAKLGFIFNSFPAVLTIRLKPWQKAALVPVYDRYEYPPQIDLAEFLDPSADRSQSWVYHLYAVVVHFKEETGGFYFAFIKPGRTEGWLKFHDDQVTHVAEEEVLDAGYGVSMRSMDDGSNPPDPKKKLTMPYIVVYVRDSVMDEVLKPVEDWEVPSHFKPTMIMITFRPWDGESPDFRLGIRKHGRYDEVNYDLVSQALKNFANVT